MSEITFCKGMADMLGRPFRVDHADMYVGNDGETYRVLCQPNAVTISIVHGSRTSIVRKFNTRQYHPEQTARVFNNALCYVAKSMA